MNTDTVNSTETKHTPGPWHIGTMNDALFVINEPPRPAPIDHLNTALRTRVIAKMGEPYSEGWSHAETDANARLIAAAPELLEACKAIARIGLHRTFTCANGGQPDAECQKCIALSAIAKAEGR